MFRSNILRILQVAMNFTARNLQEPGSAAADSCHLKAEIIDQRDNILETNSNVFFLFPPKHRWQESRKTGKMRGGTTKEPARLCSETAVAESSAKLSIENQ